MNQNNFSNPEMDFQQITFNPNQQEMNQMGFNPETNYGNFNMQNYPNANENLFKNTPPPPANFNNKIQNPNFHNQNNSVPNQQIGNEADPQKNEQI